MTSSNLDALHQRARHQEKTVQLNVRLPADLKERLDSVVRRLGVNAGVYIAAVLSDTLPVSEKALQHLEDEGE